jgi:catechol-2,3-dioxygenase
MAEQTGLAGLHHVALSVRDLDVSASWYQDVLGLVEEVRLESDDRRSAIMRLPGTRHQVGLVEHRGSGPGFDPTTVGLDHVAFAVTAEEDLQAWAARLQTGGWATSGAVETPFGGMLHFTDPDGIALAMFWNR